MNIVRVQTTKYKEGTTDQLEKRKKEEEGEGEKTR